VYSTRYSCQIIMKLQLPPQIFEKSSNNKFHKNPSSKNLVVSRGRKDGHIDTETDMTKLVVAFRNFSDTPKSFMNR
jgi:hypothetical protein